jgi:hypothetical protein
MPTTLWHLSPIFPPFPPSPLPPRILGAGDVTGRHGPHGPGWHSLAPCTRYVVEVLWATFWARKARKGRCTELRIGPQPSLASSLPFPPWVFDLSSRARGLVICGSAGCGLSVRELLGGERDRNAGTTERTEEAGDVDLAKERWRG